MSEKLIPTLEQSAPESGNHSLESAAEAWMYHVTETAGSAALAGAVEVEQSIPDGLIREAMQYYISGATKDEFLQGVGVEPHAMTKYLKGLPEEEREYYIGLRREARLVHDAKDKLKASNPEFFEGRLPASSEEKLRAAGFEDYAVGFNQHDAISDQGEATAYLEKEGGVELVGYGLNQRFLLHDSRHPMDDYPLGYYTPKIGRFVYAFPQESGASDAPFQAAASEKGLPRDMFVEKEGERVVNAKYCAGFIDNEQVFHENPQFMQVEAQTDEQFELDIRDKVRSIRAIAENEGRELNQQETAVITALAAAVKARRAQSRDGAEQSTLEPRAEFDAFAEANGIDVSASGKKYELQVQQFVRGIRARADVEGRPLNPKEKHQITLAAQSVQEYRQFTAA